MFKIKMMQNLFHPRWEYGQMGNIYLAISSRDWRFPSSSPIFTENVAHHLKALRIVFIFNKTTKPDTTNNKRNIWLFP